MGFLNRYSEPIFLVLRVVAGLIFAMHGRRSCSAPSAVRC